MIQSIIYGLTVGAVLYMVSVGLSLTFGMMKIVNFAHAIIYTVGAYVLVWVLRIGGTSFAAGLLSAVAAVAILSYAIERYVVRRLYGSGIDYAIIATYALVFMGVDLLKWAFGAIPIPLGDPVGERIALGAVDIPVYRVAIIVVALVTYAGLRLFMRHTTVGKAVVAGLEDIEAARALGLNVHRYFSLMFVIGSCLAALAGVLYAPITTVHPYMGLAILPLAFAVVIVGGMDNLDGTFASAMTLGLIMGIAGRYWGQGAEAVVFGLMALVLAVRRERQLT